MASKKSAKKSAPRKMASRKIATKKALTPEAKTRKRLLSKARNKIRSLVSQREQRALKMADLDSNLKEIKSHLDVLLDHVWWI